MNNPNFKHQDPSNLRSMLDNSSQDPSKGNWKHLEQYVNFAPRSQVLDFCIALSAHIPGNIIEFGVAYGDSTKVIRNSLQRHQKFGFYSAKQIFACDSFEGLREKFENAEVGTFACEPPKIPGVKIVKGYFEDSLTPELARTVGKVSFAHLDADLYSSTYCALTWLTPLLQTGSLLLFDEFLGENQSEKRAFLDWLAATGIKTVLIAEFGREPSGWGETTDRRLVYQVIKDETVAIKPVSLRAKLISKLRAYRQKLGV
ncbi:TylF/MycF/NovP-related O-methyltransferase [Anabaena sp. UHCC 0451]|uniref:TylF/MycF/NovP-related O-methyltransferase n=1 Tax=Anabaena sp. UHCC 0451 TaxID=2055235 RepID=UPI002B1EBD54|nr:TylF/MycF/NovP-related O-methyltransferase [Anabaena sp. UHCC 0451]MEA5577332.1 TylF/MycF/NovP-related O-methyltransferase [Anabaena sp. UHCC 0451]